MDFNIDYENAIDFEHCENIGAASMKLSLLTNLLNKVIVIRQMAKQEILQKCASYSGENFHKLSWENKIIRLIELSGSSELAEIYSKADSAYRQIKNKQAQVIEDLMALKKVIEVTPR